MFSYVSKNYILHYLEIVSPFLIYNMLMFDFLKILIIILSRCRYFNT